MTDLVDEAQALAEARLRPLPRRLAHVRGVAAAAERASSALGLVDEADVVVAAGWLHDVGYAPTIRSTGFHALDGAEFLEVAGWPPDVVSLVAFHTGADAEADERGLADRLGAIQRPKDDLLDLITYADLVTGPDGSGVEPVGRIEEILTRYGSEHLVHRAVSRSGPDLLAAVVRVRRRLAAAANQPR